MMRITAPAIKCVLAVISGIIAAPANAAELDDVTQLVVSVAPTWDSKSGLLQCFERKGGQWRAAFPPWPVLYGKNGLAWGRGALTGNGSGPPPKHEKDGRAPAGVFRLGTIYTYDSALPPGANYPFHTVTKADAWIDDVTSPDYNRHVVIDDPANPPAWFEKQKMRHNDFAYRWLVEIRHNADPPVPGAGSAIFFHIRRGPQRPSAGCTTMAESDLVKLICWLRADAHPHYVLLPRDEYRSRSQAWGLPSNAELTGNAELGTRNSETAKKSGVPALAE